MTLINERKKIPHNSDCMYYLLTYSVIMIYKYYDLQKYWSHKINL